MLHVLHLKVILAHSDCKWPPFADKPLSMHGGAFSVVNSFFGHQSEGNDAGIYFARYFAVDPDLLPINKIAYFVLAFIIVDAIAVGLPLGSFYWQLIEIGEIPGLDGILRVSRFRYAREW